MFKENLQGLMDISQDFMLTATYCLFCVSGQEKKVMERLSSAGFFPFAPEVVRWKKSVMGMKKCSARLLPGYVFFERNDGLEPDWDSVRHISSVLKILAYSDGQRSLRGADRKFIAWLKGLDGKVEVSRVIKIGTKIEFVDGPLREMQGKVIKVNKNRKVVAISFGEEETFLNTIWCPIEYVEANANTDELLN